jgi:hypothetical protein
VVGGLSWDYDEKWRAVFIIEGEVGPTSEVESCRGPVSETSDNCVDAAVLGGLRFRPTPHATGGRRPFADVLLGSYWKGSGVDDHEFNSRHFAIEVGTGLEIRWANSIQGVRIAVHVRRVLAGDRDRTQFRLMCAYVIGPRRFTR